MAGCSAGRADGRDASAIRFWSPASEDVPPLARAARTSWPLPCCRAVGCAARGGVRGSPLEWGDAVHSESTFANHLGRTACGLGKGRAGSRRGKSEPACGRRDVHGGGREPARRAARLGAGGSRSRQSDRRRPTAERRGHHHGELFGPLRGCGAARTMTTRPSSIGWPGRHPVRSLLLRRHAHASGQRGRAGRHAQPAASRSADGRLSLGSQPLPALPRRSSSKATAPPISTTATSPGRTCGGSSSCRGSIASSAAATSPRQLLRPHLGRVRPGDLFERANREFAQAASRSSPAVLTLSNHAPFELPQPLPFPEDDDRAP